jgi:hypothetical protein
MFGGPFSGAPEEGAKVQLSKIIPQAGKNLFPGPYKQRNILIFKY